MRSTFLQLLVIFSSPEFSLCIVCVFAVRGAPGECYYNTVLCCAYFSSSSVVSLAFSALCVTRVHALCVYSTFGHHLYPVGYLCSKLRFFWGLHCCASPRRKIVYSITHSIAQSPSLFDAQGTEACASEYPKFVPQRICCLVG